MITRRFTILIFSSLSLLFIPFLAGIYTSEVNWNAIDYSVAAFLLVSICIGIETVVNTVRKRRLVPLMIVGVILSLLLVWVGLAVG